MKFETLISCTRHMRCTWGECWTRFPDVQHLALWFDSFFAKRIHEYKILRHSASWFTIAWIVFPGGNVISMYKSHVAYWHRKQQDRVKDCLLHRANSCGSSMGLGCGNVPRCTCALLVSPSAIYWAELEINVNVYLIWGVSVPLEIRIISRLPHEWSVSTF